MKMKRPSIFLLAFAGLALTSACGEYFTTDVFKEEIHNNAHFAMNVEPEIQGVYAHKFVTPTDNKYSTQKNYSMNIVGDIESVWDDYQGEGTTIAIIDDGFDHDHPEYTRADGTSAILSTSRYYYTSGSKAYFKSYSSDPTCIDEDWDTDYAEWATHGTNTSSTAAAPMGNGGIVGIAPKANILALKIDMSFAAIKAAMQYAIDQGVDVINMSLGAFAETFTDGFNERQEGSSSTATYLNSVCDNAYNAGVIVVAAAGNEATSHKSYPACNNHVIGVGALAQNKANELAAFTNFNSSETQGDEKNVDILAPGFVYAAGITGSKSKHTTTWHDTQGTSFSSPIVAGAAALWKEKNPDGTPAQFEEELTSSAAGISTYKDAKVNPATYYNNSSYKNNLDANLACGRLDVGNLMSLSHDATGITISQSTANLYTAGTSIGNTTVELSADIKPSTADNKNITWTTSNSNVAKLSKSSSISGEKITITAGSVAGTSTITAKSVQGSYAATCLVTTSQYVPVTSFTLKDGSGKTSSTIQRNQTLQLVPSILPSNATEKTVLYESENESIAKVDGGGLVTGRGAGTTKINAICGNECLESSYTVTVEQAEGSGSFFINLYDSSTLNDAQSDNKPNTDYLNNKVTVDGVVDNSVVNNFSYAQCYLRRGGLSLGSSSKSGTFTIDLDSQYQISTAYVVTNKWKDDTTPTLTLNGISPTGSYNAVATPLSDNSSKLTFSNLNNASSLEFSASSRCTILTIECEFGTAAPTGVTGVSLNKTTANLDLNGNTSLTLVPTISPSNASDKAVTWNSLNPGVASVSNGVVTALNEGQTTITVTTHDGSFTASCVVTVSNSTPVVTNVVINGAVEGQELEIGKTVQLGAKVNGENDPSQQVTWTASNAKATVSASGLVKGISTGSVTITVTSKADTTKKATITLNIIESTGSGTDVGDYYASITDDMSGTTLLNALHSLNVEKQVSRVGYDSMGTSASGMFKYTDYDPATVQTDSQGRKYGTKILGFYSGKSITSFNREHVWPASRTVGGRNNDPLEDDIHMSRPTSSSDNGDRGNSFFVEGMNSSTSGWDPANCGDSTYRGDSARIIFYSAIFDTRLSLVDSETDSQSNHTMGKLSDLLKWNKQLEVKDREMNRNEGAQALQGNRNPFIDHPEYACRIWGNTNAETRAICGTEETTKTLTNLNYSGSPTKKTYVEGESFNSSGLTVNATYSDGTTANVTNSIIWTPSTFTLGDTSVRGSYSYGGVTKNITVTGITVTQNSGGTIIVDGDGNVVSMGELQTGFSTNNGDVTKGGDYLGIYSGNYIKSSSNLSIVAGSDIDVSYDIGTYGGLDASKQTLTVGAYANGTLVSTTATIQPSGKNTSQGSDTGSVSITLNSGVSSAEIRFTSASSSESSKFLRIYNLSVIYEEDSGSSTGAIINDEITKTGNLYKTTYNEGENFDPRGLTFTVSYSDGSTKTLSYSDITWSPNPLTLGTTSVVGTYEDFTGIATITISGITVTSGTTPTPTSDVFEKVTTAPTDWSGTYLLAYVTGNTAKVYTGVDEANNTVDAIINNNQISYASGMSKIEIESISGGYSLKVIGGANNGKYLSGGTKNGMNFDTTATASTIKLNDDNTITICNNSTTSLLFNSATDQQRIRYMKSGLNLTLFKMSSGTPSEEKTMTGIEIQTSVTKVAFASTTGDYLVPATVNAVYDDNSRSSITPDFYDFTINTLVLGNQKITADYQGFTAETTVKVTNEGSSEYVGNAGDPVYSNYSFNISNLTAWSGYVTDSAGSGLTFTSNDKTIKIARTYLCSSGSGSSAKYQFHKTNTGEVYNITDAGILTSISFTGSGDTFVVYAGNSVDGCTNKITGTVSNGNYSFDLSNFEYKYFKITRDSKSSTSYISNVVVNTKVATTPINTFNATPLQQAEAWATYFINMTRGENGPCLSNDRTDKINGLKSIWSELSNEYAWMVAASKDEFCDTNATGVIAEAMQHYQFIISQYGSEGLDNFVKDGSNNAPVIRNDRANLLGSLDSSNALIIIVAITGLSVIGAFVFIKKKKEN